MTLGLILAFTMLLILSPMMLLRPSRRDQRVGQLRQHARDAGITVKLAKSPLHDPPAGLVRYRWRYAQERPGPYFVLVRETYASEALKPFGEDQKSWRWRIEPLRSFPEEARSCLAQALEELPEDALVLESDRRYLTLWWGESQSVDAFNASHATLSALCKILGNRVQERSTKTPI